MSSTFGTLFRISTFGESHCKGVGVIVDGVPPCMPLNEEDIQPQLDRRRPGQNDLTTPRQEADRVVIQSGTEDGQTLGTPISLYVANKDHRPGDYGEMAQIPRPGHADFTYQEKYGIRAGSGGGRSSARETIGRVAGGAIAEKWLAHKYGVEIVAWVSAVGEVSTDAIDPLVVEREEIDASLVRCPDAAAADSMIKTIEQVRDNSDSVGGIVTCVCRHVPSGWGEPVFDKLEALLAHAMLSLPATKAFEFGSGFAGTTQLGSQHNDPFVQKVRRLGTSTNNSGGIQGGITNGEPIVFRVGFKPPATIGQAQETASFAGDSVTLAAKGRHDPCVVARAVPIVESMAALVLADAALRQASRKTSILGDMQ